MCRVIPSGNDNIYLLLLGNELQEGVKKLWGTITIFVPERFGLSIHIIWESII